jgi:hypothetical protein
MFEHLKIQPFCFIRQFPSGSVITLFLLTKISLFEKMFFLIKYLELEVEHEIAFSKFDLVSNESKYE